ncbi:nucleotidyltransferase domain-containing protein [Leptolyngbya sp. PCC 6406]|uniref:nucleotidyltransferase domain-containing protein n=1 Tax=Leptolyngbya sp. PCC 6406 TaxID=1173264 RepID=UPI0002ACCBB4|nr:nucleotidyltransferase domain-containing protein [Leptolyngbya sp. PCC 6406]
MMSPRDRTILNEFSDQVRQKFPDAQIWAFGSRARGDAKPDSDFDICVVVETLNDATWNVISHIAWSVGFEHEVLITTIKYSRQKFEQSPCSASPLVRNILREGIAA